MSKTGSYGAAACCWFSFSGHLIQDNKINQFTHQEVVAKKHKQSNDQTGVRQNPLGSLTDLEEKIRVKQGFLTQI